MGEIILITICLYLSTSCQSRFPLQYYPQPSDVCSAIDVSCPSPLQIINSLYHLCYPCLFPDLLLILSLSLISTFLLSCACPVLAIRQGCFIVRLHVSALQVSTSKINCSYNFLFSVLVSSLLNLSKAVHNNLIQGEISSFIPYLEVVTLCLRYMYCVTSSKISPPMVIFTGSPILIMISVFFSYLSLGQPFWSDVPMLDIVSPWRTPHLIGIEAVLFCKRMYIAAWEQMLSISFVYLLYFNCVKNFS